MQRVIDILKTEKKCVSMQDQPFGEACDRDCSKCDLVLPTNDVLQAYTLAIGCIEGMIGEQKKGHKEGAKWTTNGLGLSECSNCKTIVFYKCCDWKFCPYCGAEMEKEDD